MSSSSFDGNDGEVFGHVDDGDVVEEPDQRAEEAILRQDDYREADRYGNTPEEAREGESLDLRLVQERADVPGTPGDPARGAEPASGVLAQDGPLHAEEAGTDPTAGPEQDAVHTVPDGQGGVTSADGVNEPAEAVDERVYGNPEEPPEA